jgi:hypothetical protein
MKSDENNVIPPGVLDQLKLNMTKLEEGLKQDDPEMPSYLRESHKVLIAYPETVHLLDDHEIHQLIIAAEKHTQTEIIKATATKKAGKSKASQLDIGDL